MAPSHPEKVQPSGLPALSGSIRCSPPTMHGAQPQAASRLTLVVISGLGWVQREGGPI
jgi:hypothetical protein